MKLQTLGRRPDVRPLMRHLPFESPPRGADGLGDGFTRVYWRTILWVMVSTWIIWAHGCHGEDHDDELRDRPVRWHSLRVLGDTP